MIEFVVPGRPVPKGRPRLGVHGRKAYVYTPPITKEYEKLVGWVARCAGCKPLNGPLAVKLHLFIRGRSGDVDNYCKSILDGLNGIAYEDDDQVVELLVRKHRVKAAAEERVEIEIREASAWAKTEHRRKLECQCCRCFGWCECTRGLSVLDWRRTR